ncbi:MAG: hypothetical protein IIC53_10895, partial [Proteobacteria bacterium]|nr:hypothetical protein [Pseudomonadota bacterium]
MKRLLTVIAFCATAFAAAGAFATPAAADNGIDEDWSQRRIEVLQSSRRMGPLERELREYWVTHPDAFPRERAEIAQALKKAVDATSSLARSFRADFRSDP